MVQRWFMRRGPLVVAARESARSLGRMCMLLAKTNPEQSDRELCRTMIDALYERGLYPAERLPDLRRLAEEASNAGELVSGLVALGLAHLVVREAHGDEERLVMITQEMESAINSELREVFSGR